MFPPSLTVLKKFFGHGILLKVFRGVVAFSITLDWCMTDVIMSTININVVQILVTTKEKA